VQQWGNFCYFLAEGRSGEMRSAQFSRALVFVILYLTIHSSKSDGDITDGDVVKCFGSSNNSNVYSKDTKHNNNKTISNMWNNNTTGGQNKNIIHGNNNDNNSDTMNNTVTSANNLMLEQASKNNLKINNSPNNGSNVSKEGTNDNYNDVDIDDDDAICWPKCCYSDQAFNVDKNICEQVDEAFILKRPEVHFWR